MSVQFECYICLGKLEEPIYPAGCTHGICKKHLQDLKVNFIHIII